MSQMDHLRSALRSALARKRNAETRRTLALAAADIPVADVFLAEADEERAAVKAIQAAIQKGKRE